MAVRVGLQLFALDDWSSSAANRRRMQRLTCAAIETTATG